MIRTVLAVMMLLLSGCGAPAVQPATPVDPSRPYTRGAILHREDFTGNLSRWVPELEKGGNISAKDGVLTLDVPGGCSVWFKTQLEGPILIHYEARLIKTRASASALAVSSTGGAAAIAGNDRVSDLNCFWMATDTRNPSDFFAVLRSGKFADYNQLRTYYVGQGGNGNTTTRFRRYIGYQTNRPLLPEHDLTTHLLVPNQWQTVQLVACGHLIEYYNDGVCIFRYQDPEPYTRGYFAFRTTWNHMEVRHFSICRLIPAPVM